MRCIYDSLELVAAVLFRTPLKDPKGLSIMYLSRTILYSSFGTHMTHEAALRGETNPRKDKQKFTMQLPRS